jgi:hypothetical protein
MKNIIYKTKLMVLAALMLLATSCENDFDELNTNTTSLPDIDPALLLNGAILNTSYTTGASGGSGLIFDMGVVQQIVSPTTGLTTGANINKENRGASGTLWANYYANVIRNTKQVLYMLDADATNSRPNLRQMTRIHQAYAFMVLTDEYGDIPYSKTGAGYQTQTQEYFFPVYDKQEDIYTDIIKELREAAAALNGSNRVETLDALYAGNVDKWKKYAYSLMLRAGMRLSKVNPTLAQSVVADAFAGGVILANADNAVLRHDANNRNPFGTTLNTTESANYYLGAPFVDYLKSHDDPRLSSIAVRYVGATSGGEQNNKKGATSAANMQIGMPVGTLTNSTIPADPGKYFGYSQADRVRVASLVAPIYLVTAAQSQLLLAEARFRNWITTGDVDDYYDAGVRLHMQQMDSYSVSPVAPGSAKIEEAAIDAYLLAHPYDAGDALNQINTQYWVASFMNAPEAFANFRRSGFPVLTPNPATGQEITAPGFIRRLQYPNSEVSVNTANLQAAATRMGGEKMDTRVWWDIVE